MPDSVLPSCTTYFVVWLAAVTGAAAALSVLVRMTSVLLAVRVFAWASGTDPCILIATRVTGRMLQASTTHADLIHVRIVLSLSFQGDQRRTLLVRTPRFEPVGRKGLRLAAPPGGRIARSASRRHDAPAAAGSKSGARPSRHRRHPALRPRCARRCRRQNRRQRRR